MEDWLKQLIMGGAQMGGPPGMPPQMQQPPMMPQQMDMSAPQPPMVPQMPVPGVDQGAERSREQPMGPWGQLYQRMAQGGQNSGYGKMTNAGLSMAGMGGLLGGAPGAGAQPQGGGLLGNMRTPPPQPPQQQQQPQIGALLQLLRRQSMGMG
jgi:hypothetical protein